jgi:hypothetical protein
VTEILNVRGEEIVYMKMEDMSNINVDDLMADLVKVQTVLQCNNIGQTIDANEIYEKLEELAFMDREERIEYVATQLLYKSGVIDDTEVAPKEHVVRFSQQASEDSCAAESSSSDGRWPASEVSGLAGTQAENGAPFVNKIFTGCSRMYVVTKKCVNVPSTAVLAFINNENQNSEDCNIKIQQHSLQKSDAVDKTLMDEAELIHSIVPHHSIDQIYMCLETYRDDHSRVDIVIDMFLKKVSESAVSQLPSTQIPLVSGKVKSTVTIPTSDNWTPSSDENHDCDRYLQHNRSLEDLPFSVISVQETADSDLQHRNRNNSELTDERTCQERALAAAAQSQGCRKKEITYEEFTSSLSHFDPELRMRVWEAIGSNYSKVKEFIDENKNVTSINNQYNLLLGLFPNTDAEFLREKSSMIGNNEAALEEFIEEQLQSKTDSLYLTLQDILPEHDPDFLRKKCDEFGDDETVMTSFVAEQLQEQQQQKVVDGWYQILLARLPDVDPEGLFDILNRIGSDEDAMRLFITQDLDEMEGVKFQTLLTALPDADPDYLDETFQRIGHDENSVKEFLLKALETKDYPTRKDYQKRQEKAAIQRKYKEEFNIENFIETFPDPWKYFCEEDNNKGNQLITNHGMAYLEARYGRIALGDIRSSFQKNKHNLTLTCSELDKWNGPVQPQRETYECTVPKTEDVPLSFLQEVIVMFINWDVDCVYFEEYNRDKIQGK